MMIDKKAIEVAGVLNHYRKSRAVTTEEMDQAIDELICERTANANPKAFREILKNVPDAPVTLGDEIIQDD